jgi:RNA polymerase sigma factor (sigma-70 family)
VLRHIQQLVSAERVGAVSDGELLQAFIRHQDDAAFSALLRRHGPLVLAVCRRVLNHEQDAEDAFQATFVLLARHAGSLRKTQSLASWLYRVAYRTALKAGLHMARRRIRENEYARSNPRTEAPSQAGVGELETILHEELCRLPTKYQAPLVLCCLEGKSGTEAARHLGWKAGTLRGRLTQARRLLRRRLARRGVELGVVLSAATCSQQAVAGALPANLITSAVQAARLALTGKIALAGVVSARVAALVEGADHLMLVSKFRILVVLFLMVSIFGGVGLLAQPASVGVQANAGEKVVSRSPQGPPPAPARDVRTDRYGDPLPEGALARFGTIRWRQGWMASRVLFSPDGTKLALLGYGRPIGLWDVATGKQIHQFHNRDSQPGGAAFSPDGKLLAEGDVAVRLWDTRTGALRRELPAAEESQRAVLFTPDGNTVISAGHDKVIHLWNVHTGVSLGQLEGHDASAWSLAITQDGRVLASTGNDKVIRLWNLARRKPILEIKGLGHVVELAFSPDGRWLASAEEDNAPVRVWDVRTGKERFRFGDVASRGQTVAFSPDGRLVASGHSDGAIHLWDAATGKDARRWSCRSAVKSLAFSPDGKTLATTSLWDSGPRLWDTASGKEIHPTDAHRGMVTQICLSPAGNALLSLSNDRQVIQWDLATQTPRRLLELPFGKTSWKDYYAQLSADGRILARAARLEKTVTLIDPQTQKTVKAVTLPDEPYFLRFSPDGQTLAIGGQAGGFFLWKWRDSAAPRRIETPEKDLTVAL